jgi:signal transduction histidine kinase
MAFMRLPRLRVLLVEDNPDDARLLRRALDREQGGQQGGSITLTHARRLSEARAALDAGAMDAILLDLTLPDSSGVMTVRRMHEAAPETPIVVLTGSEDLGIEAIHEGAQDYLTKGEVDVQLLQRALGYAIERQRQQEQARELLNEQAARMAAEEAVRARDEFLSVAAHELYTPIAALQLSVQSLIRDFGAPSTGGTSATQRKLRIIDRQSARLVRLAHSLLEVSSLRSGRFELSRQQVDLVAIVAEVTAGLEAELARSGSTINLHGERSLVGLWDRDRLEQVITNLLTNAIKYGSSQPIDVIVSGTAATAILTVTDHGIGIPQERQQRIFSRYERAVPARQYGGMGLGLYIVARIVDAHGGFVRLESQPGKGSTFTVGLPRLGPPSISPVPLPQRGPHAE